MKSELRFRLSMAHVCITGNEQSPAALEQRLERVLYGHPRVLCELRLDYLDLSPANAFSFLARLPSEMAHRLVLTQRLKASGPVAAGQCSWDVMTWQSWWKDVMAIRPWFAVDLDWLVLDRLAGESLGWGGKFRTRHPFFSLHGSLKEIGVSLPELVASAKEHGAGVKIAAPVTCSRDLAQLAEYAEALKELPFFVTVAMGSSGRIWRWSKAAGNLTYFAAEEGRSTAPGQETFSSVLPYLQTKQRPELYALLGDNPDNRYGEEIWNRVFLKRGAKQRYVNVPLSDEPGATWSENTLFWMDRLGVSGASVTKPFKLSFPEPTNTLHKEDSLWARENTDGSAVWKILQDFSISPGAKVVIAGGGGAAQAVKSYLENKKYLVEIWKRDLGKLGPCPEGAVFLSTWPGIYQEALVQALPENPQFCLIVDAQFQRTEEESPLANWGRSKGIVYVHGQQWWKEQARAQDRIWFGKNRLGLAKDSVEKLVPSSKSETIRAYALAAACGVVTEVQNAALNDDSEIFLSAMEAVGVHIDRNGEKINLYPDSQLQAPTNAVPVGEGATGFRILLALSHLMKNGPLLIQTEKSLFVRPMEEFLAIFSMEKLSSLEGYSVPVGQALPSRISMDRSSQFASACLIAAAGSMYRGQRDSYELEIVGEWKSLPYLQMTIRYLEKIGITTEWNGKTVRLQLKEKKKRFFFEIERDASSLTFLELISRLLNLDSWMEETSLQGDQIFPELLEKIDQGLPISLKDTPDLAPPLWAYAALKKSRLVVEDSSHLRFKETDRSKYLVQAALAMGAKGECTEDGFWVDFQTRIVHPKEVVFLPTQGDHRLAMAYGVVGFFEPGFEPDRRDCVRKSFPYFWQALQILKEAIPG